MNRRSLISLGDRVASGISSFQKKADGITSYLAAFVTLILIVSAMSGVVNGQAAPYYDVTSSYEASMGKVNASTNDSGQNIQTLDESSRLASGINLMGDLVGMSVYGPDAVSRAQELGLPQMTQVGLLGVMNTEVMALAYDPPGVSLPDHLAKQWVPGYENSVTSVYAQGEGEGYVFLRDTIKVEPIWEMMRNFSYALFVIIIMAAGFMVMFRSKIGGQTTVSVLNAIPSVLIGLLAVTFSFAIVGFIMDIGRLVSLMINSYMSGTLGIATVQLGDPFDMAWSAFNNIRQGFPGISNMGVFGTFFMATIFIPGVNLIGIIGVILILVLAAVAFYAVIRVYITLIMSYLKILVELIFSPLYILLGSLPGRSGAITDWIKRILSHVMVFPVIIFLLNIAAYIGDSSMNTGFNQAIHHLSGTTGSPSLIQVRGIFVIAIYFIAAGAPAIVSEMIGAAESKGVQDAIKGAKDAAKKVPLVGGLFAN